MWHSREPCLNLEERAFIGQKSYSITVLICECMDAAVASGRGICRTHRPTDSVKHHNCEISDLGGCGKRETMSAGSTDMLSQNIILCE